MRVPQAQAKLIIIKRELSSELEIFYSTRKVTEVLPAAAVLRSAIGRSIGHFVTVDPRVSRDPVDMPS